MLWVWRIGPHCTWIRRLEHLCPLSYEPVASEHRKLRSSHGHSRDGRDEVMGAI